MRQRLPALVALCSAIGCVNSLNDANYHYACNVDTDCPSGQTCNNGLCESSTVDGGGDAGVDAGSDAGVDGGVDAGLSCLTGVWTVNPVGTYSDALVTDIAVGDFNHDGLLDLIALDSSSGGLAELLNLGGGAGLQVESDVEQAPICESLPPNAVVAADFDGDGWTDVAVAYPPLDSFGILINDQDGGFIGGPLDMLVSSASCVGIHGDAGVKDGWPNTFRPMSVAPGDGGFVLAVVDPTPDGGIDVFQIPVSPDQDANVPIVPGGVYGIQPTGIVTYDINHDGLPDLVAIIPGNGGSEIAVELASAAGGLAHSQSITGGTQTGDLIVADVNGDGFVDLIYVNTADNDIGVNFGRDGGFANTAVTFSTVFGDAGASPLSLVVADFDGDGRLDIATVNGSVDAGDGLTGSITILQGLADGGFLAVANFATKLNAPRVIRAANFLNDGGALPWIAVAYSNRSPAAFVDVFASPCAPAP